VAPSPEAGETAPADSGTTGKRMLIDWHTNLWLPEHMGAGQQAELQRKTGRSVDASPDAHRRNVVDACDKFACIAMKWNRLGIHIPNEFVAEYVQEHRGRAVGFACADPADSDGPAQFERAVVKLGLRGLKFSPVYAGFHPWSREAWRFYEIANDLKVPILWHQSAAYADQSTLEYGNPILLDRIARSFPELRMILAHVGQPWIGETIVLLRKHRQLFSDLSARYYRKWQCYNALMLAIDYAVTDQLLFGSDFPIQTTQAAMASFQAINDWGEPVSLPRIPDELIDDILYNRPFELLWPDGIS
jgi:predicted TIM-barrel fold metal-dependent hydrolase